MKGKSVWFGICLIAMWAIAASWSVSARAGSHGDDDGSPVHFAGVINDYPVSTTSTGGTIGPWEVRGPWSLDLQPRYGTANFSAALTMEFSDLAVLGTNAPTTDARNQHTHQITMKDATLTLNPSDCPGHANGTPSYTDEIEVTGMANVSGNGGSPFGLGVLVPLQVCIGGSTNVQYSNLTLVFTNLPNGGGPSAATRHFGAQPIHGVVRVSR
jgi:hypothetical protein